MISFFSAQYAESLGLAAPAGGRAFIKKAHTKGGQPAVNM